MNTLEAMTDVAKDAAESLPEAFGVLTFVFHGKPEEPSIKIYQTNCAHDLGQMPAFLAAMSAHYAEVVSSLGPKSDKPPPTSLFIPGPRPLFIPPK